MAAKAVVFAIAQVLLVQYAVSQSIGRFASPACGNGAFGLSPALTASAFSGNSAFGNGLAYNGLAGNALNRLVAAPAFEATATSGGALPVSSVSAVPPVGIAVESENAYEGALAVGGELPFVGTVSLEGVLPSAGAGAVNHACGNGANRMASSATGTTTSSAVSAPGAFGFGGIGSGIAAENMYGPGLGAFGSSAAAFGAGIAPAFGSALSPASALGYNNGINGLNNFAAGKYGAVIPAAGYAAGNAIAPGAAYGGAGEGNVAVAGELPVAGNTAVAGQVPIMGAVNFGGAIPAAGAVSIAGQCACGCGNNYL